MRTSSATKSTLLRLDRVVVFVVFLLLGALALSSPLLVGINGMRVAGCRSACDPSLVGAGGAVIMAGCIGATLLAFTGLLVLPRPDRYLWWLPCSALVIAAGMLLLGNHLIDVGVGA